VTWGPPRAIGNFNRQIEACPHTGGALALGSETQHALVWTGNDGARGLHVFSTPAAAPSWTAGHRLGGEYAQRGDLAAHGSQVIAVWDEPAGRVGAVFLSRSRDRGVTWSEPMKLSGDTVHAVYPRVVATASAFAVFWTESAPGGAGALRTIVLR
jgi:hypothetical protein